MKRLFFVLLALLIAVPALAGPPGWRPGAGKSMTIGSVAIGTSGSIYESGTDMVLDDGSGDPISLDTIRAGAGTDDQTAAEVPFTPAGDIAAETTQAAIEELDDEKQPIDADLTTAAGAGAAGNSKYFGTNAGGTPGFYDLPAGGADNLGNATYADVVALFGEGSCSGVLLSDGTCVATSTFGDMDNPMTTAGDIIYGGASGAPTRLAGSANNDYVLAYNTSTNAPYWKVDATGAGGDQLVDIVTTAPLLVNGGAAVNDALPGSDSDITFSMPAATNATPGHATAEQIQTLESLDGKLPSCTPGSGDCGAEVPPNTLSVASWPAPTTGTNSGLRPFTGGRWYVYDISNTTWRLLTIAEDWDAWNEHPALTQNYMLVGNESNQPAATAPATVFSTIKQAATDSTTGVVELATTAETTTGTDTGRAVTPDGLSGSVYGMKEIGWTIYDPTVDTAVADGTKGAAVPSSMNSMNLIDLTCSVDDLNSAASGATTVVIRRVRGATAVDMTSTGVTIAYNEYTASDETVDTINDDLQTGDKLYIDVNAVTTAVQKGLSCTAVFQTP